MIKGELGRRMAGAAGAAAFMLAAALWPSGIADAGEPPAPLLRFAVISDIHVQQGNKRSEERLRQALQDLHETVPDASALVINGDLGNGSPEDYAALGQQMRRLPHPEPTFYTIGNHEFYRAWTRGGGGWNPDGFPNGDTDSGAIGRFLDFTGYPRVYRDAWVERHHFLFLGSEAYRQSVPSLGEEAWLSEEQLDWLERSMQLKANSGRPVFVFLHQPLLGTLEGSTAEPPVYSGGLDKLRRLKGILARYPHAVLFSGHTHRALGLPGTVLRDGFTMVNSSSVYEPLGENNLPTGKGEVRSEGLVVEVYRDKIRIRGRDFARKVWVFEADALAGNQ